jgi:hypothetical protein
MIYKLVSKCVILGVRREVDDNCALMCYYAASSGKLCYYAASSGKLCVITRRVVANYVLLRSE